MLKTILGSLLLLLLFVSNVSAEDLNVSANITSANITIYDGAFDPATYYTNSTLPVIWYNVGTNSHDVLGSGWGVSGIPSGWGYFHTFSSWGLYPYLDYPGMNGTIVVVNDLCWNSTSITPIISNCSANYTYCDSYGFVQNDCSLCGCGPHPSYPSIFYTCNTDTNACELSCEDTGTILGNAPWKVWVDCSMMGIFNSFISILIVLVIFYLFTQFVLKLGENSE